MRRHTQGRIHEIKEKERRYRSLPLSLCATGIKKKELRKLTVAT